jgi:hypothetical protein
VVVVRDLGGMHSAIDGETIYVAESGSQAENEERARSALLTTGGTVVVPAAGADAS